MTCSDLRPRLPDLADDLLEPSEAARLTAHLATCPACTRALEEIRAAHARMDTPWVVPAPPADLASRIVARAAQRRSRGWAFGRHAASFAAGVLLTLGLTATGGGDTPPSVHPATPPVPATAQIPAPAEAAPVPGPSGPLVSPFPRRIR